VTWTRDDARRAMLACIAAWPLAGAATQAAADASLPEDACRRAPAAPGPLGETLLEMPADSWYRHPGSAMRSVCAPGVRGNCRNVVAAWSGAALDPARRRLLVWGGGHADYYGNELYAFELAAGTWQRLTEPSHGVVENQDPLPDGQPVSRHTYDGVEVMDHADRLFAHGGSRAGDGSATNVTWTFDLRTNTWRNEEPSPSGPGGFTAASAYDPGSGVMLVRSTRALHDYDPEQNSWRLLQRFDRKPLWPRYEVGGNKVGAVDPLRRLFWSIGDGDFLVWNIAEAAVVSDEWALPQSLRAAPAPGLDYDHAADALVAWPNRGAPFILDLGSGRWSRGSGIGAPESRTSGGTFGRWRYVADYNVFVLVTAVDEDVHFYKHTRCR